MLLYLKSVPPDNYLNTSCSFLPRRKQGLIVNKLMPMTSFRSLTAGSIGAKDDKQKLNLERGIILILVLMFLFVISLLTFSLLEQGCMELKMANHFKEKMIKFSNL